METAYFYGIIDDKYTDFNANAFRGWIFTIATATIEKEDEIFEKLFFYNIPYMKIVFFVLFLFSLI